MFNTERLYIRELQPKDIDRLCEYRNKPEVSKYQSWKTYSINDAKELLKSCEKPFQAKRKDATQWGIELDGVLIGDVHVEMISETTVFIGYTLDSTYWHKGYGREAVRGLLDYLYKTFHIRKCIAYIYKKNDASRRLLLDLGFKKFDESFFYKDEGYSKVLGE